MGVLAAERIKLTSVRSPWWCSAIIVALGLGLAALMGWFGHQAAGDPEIAKDFPGLTAAVAVSGVSGFGVMVLTIMAALMVTSEYRFGLIKSTFQATPNRAKVLGAKAGLVGVYGAILTFVLGFAAFFLAKAIAGTDGSRELLFDSEGWRALYGVPIYAFLCAVLAVGVGALLRQSAAAIALLLLWPLMLEGLVGLFGSTGHKIQAFLPFQNANYFLSGDGGSVDFHWGPWGALAYFVVFVAIVFGASLFVVNRRDA